VSNYDKSLHRHDKKQKMESRKAASEEVHFQTTAKNRQRGCRRDVRRQTVPNTCSSDLTSPSTCYMSFPTVCHSECWYSDGGDLTGALYSCVGLHSGALRVERIDPFCFLAGYHKQWLNQALYVLLTQHIFHMPMAQ